MRRFLAFLVVLLLLFSLLEPVLPPPAVPAWPGRVTASTASSNAMTRPAEDDSAGRLRSAPPDQPVFWEGLLQPPASLVPLLPAHLLAATPNPQDWAALDFAAAPVGTGCFRWAGEADGAISLTAFQQAGLWPRQAGYRFVALGSAAEAWQDLRLGKLDGVTFDLPPAVGDTPAGLLKQRAARLQLQSDPVPGTQALLLLWSTAPDPTLRRLVAPVLAMRDPGPRRAAAALDELGWAPAADGWRHREGRVLQVLLDISAGSGESLPLLEETVAALVRPLRDLGIQVVLANRVTSLAEREAVTLAARLVLWDGGADPDMANLVAALPDVDADLIRQASLPRQTLDDEERLARLGALAARLQDEALVTPLARSWRISVSRQGLRAGVEKRRGEGEGAGA